jgi:hypothetical protein
MVKYFLKVKYSFQLLKIFQAKLFLKSVFLKKSLKARFTRLILIKKTLDLLTNFILRYHAFSKKVKFLVQNDETLYSRISNNFKMANGDILLLFKIEIHGIKS